MVAVAVNGDDEQVFRENKTLHLLLGRPPLHLRAARGKTVARWASRVGVGAANGDRKGGWQAGMAKGGGEWRWEAAMESGAGKAVASVGALFW